MVLPAFAFVLGLIVFLVLALMVLRFTELAPVRPVTLAAFVFADFASTLLYAVVYGRLFADAADQLQSRASVVTFIVGALIVATIAGALAARFAARIFPQWKSSV